MYTQKKEKKLQTSKNSTTTIKKSDKFKNKKECQARKHSNEKNDKYKTQIIRQIYNQLFFYTYKNQNNQNINISQNEIIKPCKRSTKKKIIRSSQNKSINQKNNIPYPLKRNSKVRLTLKNKLDTNFISNEVSKNYIKATNNTTELNLSSDEKYNITIDNNFKNESFKSRGSEINKKEKLFMVNKTNNSDVKSMEQKKILKSENNIKSRNMHQNNNLKNKHEYQTKVLNIIRSNLDFNKKRLNKEFDNRKTIQNKIQENKDNENSRRKEERKEHKKNINKKDNIIETHKIRNNIFDSLKENVSNYYYIVVAGNKLKNNDSNNKSYKIRNSENSINIKENRTFNKEKVPIYFEKIDPPSIPNVCENSLKSKPLSKVMLSKKNEIVLYDKDQKKALYFKKKNIGLREEKSISERKNNRFKNIIQNVNNLSINDSNEISNKNYIFAKSNRNSKDFKNCLKFIEANDLKSNNYHNTKIYQEINECKYNNNNFNSKEIRNSSIKKKEKRNLKKTNRSKFKGNNSRITILDINKSGKNDNKSTSNNSTNRAFSNTKKKSIKQNNSNNLKNKNANTLNKTKNNKKFINQKAKTKNILNSNFFNNYASNKNMDLINKSNEDDKTEIDDEEHEKSPYINELSKYFNEALKDFKDNNDSLKVYNYISPNKEKLNKFEEKTEDDELSNSTIKVPIFEDVNLLNNLIDNHIDKNKNFEIKNLYDIISKNFDFMPKKILLNFLDDKSLIILSSVDKQFYINLRVLFYNNIYKKIAFDKNNTFINKIKSSMLLYASNKINNCDIINLKRIYASYGDQKSIYEDLIIKDINRTFPNDINFKQNSQNYWKLYNLLTRYSNYNASIGYAQGLNFIFANALSYFDKEEEVFFFVDGLIHLFNLENYVGEVNNSLMAQIKNSSKIISKYIPDMNKHFEKRLLTHEFFSTGWILTLFSNAMNGKNLIITWSFMIVFGWKFFYCFVIQILKFYKEDIIKTNENNLSKKMKKLLKEERFSKDIIKIINNTLFFMSQNIVL